MQEILLDEKVITALSLFIISGLSFLTRSLNIFRDTMKKRQDAEFERNKKEQERQDDMMKSIRRSALRSEYLSIYNSKEFTPSEKYSMTRKLIQEYKELNGNTYIAELDNKLYHAVIMSTRSGRIYQGGRNGDSRRGTKLGPKSRR